MIRQLPRAWLQCDAAIAAILFVVGCWVAVLYCRAYERTKAPPEPWAKEMGAAIAFACGLGYADPGYAPTAAVDAFLTKRADRVSCDDLPAGTPLRPPNFTQALYRYQTLAAGLTWRLTGISWMNLTLLFGVLHATAVAAVYFLVRLASGRALAVAAALIMAVSPLELRYLPQLRDYSKVPFILILIVILAQLVTRPFTARRALMLAAAYGAVLGIGFGFRNDLLINILPFLGTVALFVPGPIRSTLRLKAAAIGVAALTFIVCAWPIVAAYRSGSNTGHVVLLGLMAPFDTALGINGSVYEWGSQYDDGLVAKIVGSYGERRHHQSIPMLSKEYDQSIAEYMTLVGERWPADFVTRAFGSALRILELPFRVRVYTTAAPPAVADGAIASAYAAWVSATSRLSGLGLPVAVVALAVVAAASVRLGIWFLVALLYFAGYPAIQFDPRHFFFLEVIPWLAIAIVVQAIVVGIRSWRSGNAVPALGTRVRARRVAAFAVVAIAGITLPVAGLRAYQQRSVGALIDGYLALPTDAPAVTPTPIDEKRVLLRLGETDQASISLGAVRYLVVDVSRQNCPRSLTPVTMLYETDRDYTDLSQRIWVRVPDDSAPFRLMFPAYESAGQRFLGVAVNAADVRCVSAIRTVVPERRPSLLPTLLLPPDWHNQKLYQTLTDWERSSAPYRIRFYAWPRWLDGAGLPVAGLALPPLSTLPHSSLVALDEQHRWRVRGIVRSPSSSLLRMPPRAVPRGTLFVVRGTLKRGGFTMGLLKDDLWNTTVNVVAPGEFLAMVEAPEDGSYAPALANYISSLDPRNEFVVTAAGWMDPTGMPLKPEVAAQ